MKLLVFLSGAR